MPLSETRIIGAEVLLGDEAEDLLAAAVEHAGGRLRKVTPRQTQYYPGRSIAVVFDATVAWAKAKTAHETLVAVAGPKIPEGALLLESDDGTRIGVWRLPHDPALPGLPIALDRRRAPELLGGQAAVSSSFLSYRPARRAVVRLNGTVGSTFVKVVRPTKAQQLRELHERFAELVPSPRVVAFSDEAGLVALEGLPGRSLADAIVAGEPLPTSEDILRLSADLAKMPLGEGTRLTAREDAAYQSKMLRAILPDDVPRIDGLLADLGTDPEGRTPVTIHGDLYEAQLLVQDGRITGVLDLDRSGPGDPADDLANLLGHLEAFALYRPSTATAARGYARALLPAFEDAVGANELRPRVAAVLLALATGPFRMMQPRWETATRRYLDAAAQWLHEGPLLHLAGTDPSTEPRKEHP